MTEKEVVDLETGDMVILPSGVRRTFDCRLADGHSFVTLQFTNGETLTVAKTSTLPLFIPNEYAEAKSFGWT